MKMSLSLKGTSELRKALEHPLGMEAIKKTIAYHGSQVQNRAQRLAPVDTGFLKRSIELFIEDGGMSAVIRARAIYSPYLEYGTRYITAIPFMGPALNLQEPAFMADIRRLIV